jgi:hypothetical protein
MGEKVGIRRWSAIAVGFARSCWLSGPARRASTPGRSGALFCGCVVLRDLSRGPWRRIHPLTVTFRVAADLIPLGAVMSLWTPWQPVSVRTLSLSGPRRYALIAYVLVVHAMRHGEIAVVTPFRYVFLIWAILIQIGVFAVWPDRLTCSAARFWSRPGSTRFIGSASSMGRHAASLPPPAALPALDVIRRCLAQNGESRMKAIRSSLRGIARWSPRKSFIFERRLHQAGERRAADGADHFSARPHFRDPARAVVIAWGSTGTCRS